MKLKIADYQSESINPNTEKIDTAETIDIMRMINNEDYKIPAAIENEIDNIAEAVDSIAEKLNQGGRMIYLGGGTCGRLGILDASEAAPYFNAPYEMVQGLIAGGPEAVYRVVPGVEDDTEKVIEELNQIKINANDAVVGISSSGSTPYVVSGMNYANKTGCLTVAVVNNQDSVLSKVVEQTICVLAGPEVLAGATVYKAGTAQKMILNMLSMGVMIKLGRVYKNLLVCVEISNAKLVERVKKALVTATGLTDDKAAEYLDKTDNNAALALVMWKLDVDLDEAKKVMNSANGNLRYAMQRKINSSENIISKV
ncbi:MAG TPA: N-acetylmuramic acid 6-phosphate etherase [Spirochaeta sp.]|nr:N-acetylmuramic acid 6-phosphate etherase [Spirochaeta sp.]